jgi:hypothetical protein
VFWNRYWIDVDVKEICVALNEKTTSSILPREIFFAVIAFSSALLRKQ